MRRQYDAQRYMRHLDQNELDARIRDILLNMLRVTPEALIGLPPINADSVIWIEKFTHALEEMQLRHGPYPAGFTRNILHREPFPDFASELASKAAKTLSAKGLVRGDVFIKFGKPEHMEALYRTGSIRIQSASYFLNNAHNIAVRDNELALPISLVLSRDQILKVVKNPQDVPPDAADQRVDVEFKSTTDYWLYCVTNSVEPRLFVDFNAHACVIIRDRAEFQRRLSLLQGDLARCEFSEGNANYVDPLLPTSSNVFVPFAKHFGYAYQDEYRFCWLPRQTAKGLQHIDVEIGSLEGIAEFVSL